jgi:hypothetical protein
LTSIEAVTTLVGSPDTTTGGGLDTRGYRILGECGWRGRIRTFNPLIQRAFNGFERRGQRQSAAAAVELPSSAAVRVHVRDR